MYDETEPDFNGFDLQNILKFDYFYRLEPALFCPQEKYILFALEVCFECLFFNHYNTYNKPCRQLFVANRR